MTAAWGVALAAALGLQARGVGEPAAAPLPLDQAVRAALQDLQYPWYDPARDAVCPVIAEPGSWSRRLGRWFASLLDWLGGLLSGRRVEAPRTGSPAGQLLSTLVMLAAGALFVVLLWRLWKLHEVGPPPESSGTARVGDAARIAGLGPSLSLEGVAPWAEALRRRAGDPAGAVIWLFLDQLVSLQRAGLIRFAPGRTARQYAQALEDPVLAEGLQTTLGAFEQVYYGHRLPSPERLAQIWAQAELFRARIRGLRGGP